MGWTSYHATCYKNGQVDRKAECDNYVENGNCLKVQKSVMKGSTYYAAVEVIKKSVPNEDGKSTGEYQDIPEAEKEIFGLVILTSVQNNDYFNFSYKSIDETSGPAERHCPVSILNLLTPTDSKWANEWRADCRKNAEKKPLGSLPVGTVIRYKNYDGQTIELEKCSPAFQFKRPFWFNAASYTYVPSRRIPDNYEIVKKTH